jgi:hypothetical protein
MKLYMKKEEEKMGLLILQENQMVANIKFL